MREIKRLNKIPRTRRSDSQSFIHSLQLDSLFDIAKCPCFRNNYQLIMSYEDCYCTPKPPRIIFDWEFYVDQLGPRRLVIGNIDKHGSAKLNQLQYRSTREERMKLAEEKIVSNTKMVKSELLEYSGESTSSEINESNDPSYIYSDKSDPDDHVNVTQNRFQYPTLAETCVRYKVSSRAAAAIYNAGLLDLGILTECNKLDHSKLDRQISKIGQQLCDQQMMELTQCICIAFDERIDESKALVKGEIILDHDLESTNSPSFSVQKIIKEEHVPILSEPGSRYIDHLSPIDGKALTLAKDLLDILAETSSRDSLKAICCDGCIKNTGAKGGVIAIIENELGRALHHFICLLHLNELPFRKLFTLYDGGTTGPNTLSGSIGKQLSKDLTSLTIVQFQPISGNINTLPANIMKTLSNDQKYLYEIGLVVHSGSYSVTPKLAARSPGLLHHARWLTQANNILRLYISTIGPSKELTRLVKYILRIFIPGWFQVKMNSCCTDGPNNFIFIIKLMNKFLNDEEKNALLPLLRRNGYFSHSENVLLAGIVDSDIQVRRKAIETILTIRRSLNVNSNNSHVRTYKISNWNFQANDYMDFIEWDNLDSVHEPPLTKDIPDGLLKTWIDERQTSIPNIPCHTQAVERTIKLVTEVSKIYSSYEKRHQAILLTLISRQKMSKFDSKKDFLADSI